MSDSVSEPVWSLEPAAEVLSGRHRPATGPPPDIPVWAELDATRRWLHNIRLACACPSAELEKTAEWLLDNDYKVHRALLQIGKDLPPSFYARLAVVTEADGERVPRVFALAHDLLRVTRLQISLTSAVRFVRVYQERHPLTIGELWAFPTMLRIACIEILVAATSTFYERVPVPFEPSEWARDPHSLEETERVARAIANLGLIASIPWEEFFDQTSVVEETLRLDPSGQYSRMDFATRDRYRREVERIAAKAATDETEVAAAAIRCANAASADDFDRHVGLWLIGRGLVTLETQFGVRLTVRERFLRFVLGHPGASYAAALTACFMGALILPIIYLIGVRAGPVGWIGALLALIVPASILAVTVVHWTITRLLPPRILPKLDFSDGLGLDAPTIIVVPVVIASAQEVPYLADQIETHWLANADSKLQIALLADPVDAPVERLDTDSEVEAALSAQIYDLNKRHGRKCDGPFHLLLRPRRYNPSEGCWMAWERKRGKLEQFNRLLVDGDNRAFSKHIGNLERLAETRFVVTVDADTMLPPGSVAKLAGTLAHPLNRPRVDETGRVTNGYSIVQPRIETSPQSGIRTLFTRLFTGDTAIDIYSHAVSDVYQDLFGAGIFTGKGIYDLHAFHRSVDGRVPANRILSHDLFEGAHGRVALATDIVLYENFPTGYLEYSQRLHRWVRGDWQLLPWLRRNVPAAGGRMLPNPFAAIERWKIVDNLRRSLIAPSMLLLALAGWLVLPGSPWFWTLLAVLAPAGQLFTDLVSGLAHGRRRGAVRGILTGLSDQAGRWTLAIVFMMHEALLSLHAIAVTLWRLLITRRRLLEWTAAAQVATQLMEHSPRAAAWRAMWPGSLASLALVGTIALIRPTALPAALPLLMLWIGAPEIVTRIERPRRSEVEPLRVDDVRYLRDLARRTWFFFETFAGPEDNWLPPDNYQGEPHEEIATRTSPTNIGMMLLSTSTSWDLGYIGRTELAARTANVFESLNRLERYRGHFFNWYDTRTLRPLEPRYVSTVDSGNLAASLVAYAAALRDAASESSLEPQRWEGLADTIRLLRAAVAELESAKGLLTSVDELAATVSALASATEAPKAGLNDICEIVLPSLETHVSAAAEGRPSAGLATLRKLYSWLDRLRHQAGTMQRDLASGDEIAERLNDLAGQAAALAYAMNFKPLYDEEQRLFFIGMNVSAGRTDHHHYDLLASEARLASFFAIAKGDVPLEHWFHLERPVTRLHRALSLVSWNGSMFEYLMPRMLLRGGPETLLGESERTAVAIQRRHGRSNGVPWGVSESAYAARDSDHRYRYQAFGVPGLGLRRGLARDMVVAPYASALALAIDPSAAVANLRALDRLGGARRFGLVEAFDYTPERAPLGHRFAPVDAFMAHHQGMIMTAIGNALLDDVVVRRFATDQRVRLVSLLLSERVPRELPSEMERLEELERPAVSPSSPAMPQPWEPPPSPAFPNMNLLGNGRLSSWISHTGGGRLSWRRQALTRFVPDSTRDSDGVWIYLTDEDSGALWSATRQPTCAPADEYRVTFHAHLAEFQRRDDGIRTRLEVAVAAGDDLEIRRLTIANEGPLTRRIRVTSYGEVVLAPVLEDERHPAFSKLFVGSEPVPGLGGLLFTRRPRGPRETPPVLVHLLIDADGPVQDVLWESDRRDFIGRGRDIRAPRGARHDLGASAGLTLDPVMALQTLLLLQPYEQREICFLTIAAASREVAIEVAERHATLASIEWVIADAAAAAARAVESAKVEPGRLGSLQTLGSLLVHPHGALRSTPTKLYANRLGQPSLWGLAISGDYPILLLRTQTSGDELLAELIGAHQFWRRQGLEIDLVVMQTGGSGYLEPLRNGVVSLLRDLGASEMLGRAGGIHLLFADQVGAAQVRLLEATAWAVLDGDAGSIAEQLSEHIEPEPELPQFAPSLPPGEDTPDIDRPTDLLFDNGIGGFSADGREYVIHLGRGESTPAPWANILANETFGSLVTESGGGFTWALNSGEHRITTWTNDAVCDRPVETLYLRDEETAAVWSATPAPAGRDAACEIRHGAGYTVWTRRSHGLEQELRTFVARDAPVKIAILKLRNLLPRYRRLTATYYAEWLMGALPGQSRRHVLCAYDADAQAILAQCCWNPDFAGRTAFLTANSPPHSLTMDRREFLGPEGDATRPAGLSRWGLSGRDAAGGDSCAAYQVHLDLAPGAADEVVFVLGEAESEIEAKALATRWRQPQQAAQEAEAVPHHWDSLLSAIQVSTPEPDFDLLVNRWLLYQCLSSRILARTGFYQSSGAVGFRDQLQDVLALLHAEPDRTRAHILDCASRQFAEGDVLHWWHPPSGRGVRTRCSDDLAWLPYAVGTYVQATGDLAILDEQIPFLEGPPLASDEEDRYAQFESSVDRWPLIDHVERALERALTQGAHGLPLIGGGDWNDGMNRVGAEGRGESVWLAWFLAVTCESVADLNHRLGRKTAALRWQEQAKMLRERSEDSGWDGAWYRRAYDDDGHPLGSSEDSECRIDSISQSWAVIAGANTDRVKIALQSAMRELGDPAANILRLLWPPFDRTPRDPGYIKAYPPGVRENGGQYSHAAAWLGLALARADQPDAAMSVFNVINPVRHAFSRKLAEQYRVEPYVVAGDIAAAEPYRGRGGWTWYTGSAAWAWRLAVEGLLGIRLCDGRIFINPCIPPAWGGFEMVLRRPEGSIKLRVEDPDHIGSGQTEIRIDGLIATEGIAFPQDGSQVTAVCRLKAPNGQNSVAN
jgi:cyclic beta-1,2-glucan synthetase